MARHWLKICVLLCIGALLVSCVAIRAEGGQRPPVEKVEGADKDGSILALRNNDDTPRAAEQHVVQAAVREVPTREEDGWRRLGENESVPRGSHVRLNMTSGEKWVKVDEGNATAVEGTEKPASKETQEISAGERIVTLLSGLDDVELGERLGAIRKLGPPGSEAYENGAHELWEERQALLRSVHKENMEASEGNATEPMVSRLSKKISVPESVTEALLEELEELVSDVDEALAFANDRHEGLRKCLDIIDHDAPSKVVKSKAAQVISAAIRGTEQLQNMTVSLDGFRRLFEALKSGEVAEKQGLNAMGALLRGSKDAAQEALRHPGFFSHLMTGLTSHPAQEIRGKAAALIGDLLHESENIYWEAFHKAGLCESSLALLNDEGRSKHISYLYEIRTTVCEHMLKGQKQEL